MNLRLDHIAIRCSDRHKAGKFFIDAMGYKIQTEFDVPEVGARCLVLEPSIKIDKNLPFTWPLAWAGVMVDYHFPPEVFISDSPDPESIVGKWVAKRGNGLHHMAFQTDNIERTVAEWKEKGYAEFTTEEVLQCPGLKQIFTTPSSLFGFIVELIERTGQGFCQTNVGALIFSTKDL